MINTASAISVRYGTSSTVPRESAIRVSSLIVAGVPL